MPTELGYNTTLNTKVTTTSLLGYITVPMSFVSSRQVNVPERLARLGYIDFISRVMIAAK